ncbi:hypothetical protein [Candidatus Amoebophilus asiaticus]|nr:hypothetical protein [Candidatus Amoebophilus asiaticus]
MSLRSYTNTTQLLNRAIQLIILLIIFSIHACFCTNASNNQNNKKLPKPSSDIHTDKLSLSFKELALAVDKSVLIGEERTVKVSLDTTKIDISKENRDQVKSKRFKLKVFIKPEENTTDPNTTSYLKLPDTSKNTEIETHLYMQNDAIDLEVVPGEGVKRVPIILALYENDTAPAPIYSTTIHWKLNAHHLLLEGLSDLINDQIINFSIKNGDNLPLDLKNTLLTITASQGVTFKANGKVCTSIDLQTLAQNNTIVLKPSENTPSIALQVAEAYEAQGSEITLAIKNGTEVIFSQVIQWKQEPLKLKLTGLHDITDDETLSFYIENNGNKPLNPENIVLSLVGTPGVIYKLQDKTTDSINLEELLASNATSLDKGTKTIPIKLQVAPNTNLNQADISLQIKKGAEEIDNKKIQWKKEPVTLKLVGLHDITNEETLSFYIENNSNKPLNTENVALSLVATPGVKWKLQNETITSISLRELLASNATSLDKGTKTIPIHLQIDPTSNPSQNKADITLQIKQGNQVIEAQFIKWERQPISLRFVGVHDIIDDEVLEFTIENSGLQPIHPRDITVSLLPTEGVAFNLNGNLLSSINLQQILPDKTTTLNKSVSTKPIQLQVAHNIGKDQAEITLQIKQGDVVIDSQPVQWKQQPIDLKFIGLHNITGNEALEFFIESNSDKPIYANDITLSLETIDSAEFRLNDKLASSISLNELLPHKAIALDKGTTIIPVKLQLQKAYKQQQATINLVLKRHETSITSNTITWYGQEDIALAFPDLKAARITGDEKLAFTIINQKDPVDMDEMLVWLEAQNSSFPIENLFTLNGMAIPSEGIRLSRLVIDQRTTVLNKGSNTGTITLQSLTTNKLLEATIKVYLKRKGQVWSSPSIQWERGEIKLNFQDIPNRQLRNADVLNFKIKNNGSYVETKDILLVLDNPVKDHYSFKINNQPLDANNSINLAKVLPAYLTELSPAQEVNISIKKEEIETSSPATAASISLQLINQNATFQSEKVEVSWELKKVNLNQKSSIQNLRNNTKTKNKNIDLKLEVGQSELEGDTKSFTVIILNQGDTIDAGDHKKISLYVTRIQGDGTIPALDNGKSNKGKKYKFVNNLFELPSQAYWEKKLTLATKDQAIIYELQLYLNKKPISEPLQVTWKPKPIGLQLKIDTQAPKWNQQDFTIRVINPTDKLVVPHDGINIKVTNIKGSGIIANLKGFSLSQKNKKDYLFIHPTFKLEPATEWQDNLSIEPLDPLLSDQEIIYELQLYAENQKIGDPVLVKWKSRRSKLQVTINKKELEGPNNHFKITVLNQGDILKDIETDRSNEGTWYIGIEKLHGDQADLEFLGKGQKKSFSIRTKGSKTLRISSPLKDQSQSYSFHIEHHRETKVQFRFTLLYVYNIDNQEKVKTIGTPITVTWKNTSKWQNYE